MARGKSAAPEGERTIGVGGNSGAELKGHIEAIERMMEDKADIQSDIKDRFVITKSQGFDPRIMRILIRRRAMEKSERDEQDALVHLYSGALGMTSPADAD